MLNTNIQTLRQLTWYQYPKILGRIAFESKRAFAETSTWIAALTGWCMRCMIFSRRLQPED